MKHTGWCFDEMNRLMGKDNFPKPLDTEDKVKIAQNTLVKLFDIEITLNKIITHDNFKSILFRLESYSDEKIRLQAHQIDESFKGLHNMLDLLNRYLLNLKRLFDEKNFLTDESIRKELEGSMSDISEMIYYDFSTMYGNLKDEFNVVLHIEEELKNLMIYEHHSEEMLK